ncbi:MAG: type II toxin-antitoxin system RelE/ParE family toxin [Deltaproteobacteria bacterium]|nr:type II toxin-antitoxin system RelE/ParE family toxin [Deltaproteobacteria bacterium]MBI5893647.1 type II toxin-antitoxin system RelE/ParE family toxin [Deltaproteobacteria bacterium]
MNWTVKISPAAEKHYKKLDKKARERIKEKLIELSREQNPLLRKDVKYLTGELKNFYRLRVGRYRVVFSLIYNENTIAVVNIAPRGSVY